MPVYEYECKDCSHKFDMRGKYERAGTAECPVCGGKAWRVFSPSAVKLGGSGYYRGGGDPKYDSCGTSYRGFG